MLLFSYFAETTHIYDPFARFAEERPMAWKYSADVDPDFETTFLDACNRHGWDPLAMLSCWNSESSVEHFAINRSSWASGIFQLMPDTAHGLGWMPNDARWHRIGDLRARLQAQKDTLSSEDKSAIRKQISDMQHALMLPFVALSATQQIPWAERFYGPAGELRTPAACYVKTFLPALLSRANEPLFVLCARNGPFADAYAGNHEAFDPDGKGYITVADLSERIERAAKGARWQELVDRIRGAQQGRDTDPEPVPVVIDGTVPPLNTVRGQQAAFTALGYPCAVDGFYGSKTRAACVNFQGDAGLVCDGICGPVTQAALAMALTPKG